MQSNAVDVLRRKFRVQRRVVKLRPIVGIKRKEEKRKRENSGALCFLALLVPRSRTTGGHVATRVDPL